jgi:hypothetical protein
MMMAPNKPFYILHYTYGMDYKLTGCGALHQSGQLPACCRSTIWHAAAQHAAR